MTREEIKQKASALITTIQQDVQGAIALQNEVGRNRWELYQLQKLCQHPETKEDSVQDGAEMKLRNFCQDCGAVVPGQ